MSRLENGKTITLPAPVGGIDQKSPLAAMPAINSPWMLNIDPYPQSLKVRNGYVIHAVITPSTATDVILALGAYAARGISSSGGSLFAYFVDATAVPNTFVYDVTTSTPSLNQTLNSNGGSRPTTAVPLLGGLAFFSSLSPFDDSCAFYKLPTSTFQPWAFVDESSNPIASPVTTSFKGRVYAFADGGIYYSEDPDIISGTLIFRDLSYTFTLPNGGGAWIAAISSPGERADEVFLAIGNSCEILVYGGDYPDSSTWGLVGQYEIPGPLGVNPIVKYGNDVWVFTQTGIVSLRDLFTYGNVLTDEGSVSVNINPYWTELIRKMTTTIPIVDFTQFPIHGVYWPERNQILTLLPGHIDQDGTYHSDIATMCVYNTISKAWAFHSIEGLDTSKIGGLTYFNGNVYFYCKNVILKVDLTGYKDETYNNAGNYSSYDFAIHGAYQSFGDEQVNKRISGFQPIMKTDFSGTKVGVRAVADFGRQVSDLAKIELVDGFNTGQYSVGAQGTYLQWRLEGESDVSSTDGLELFAMGAVLQPGGIR